MSLHLKEILHEMADTVGRPHLHEHIDALPMAGADERGETESEKDTNETPLTPDEQLKLEALQKRANATQKDQEETTEETENADA